MYLKGKNLDHVIKDITEANVTDIKEPLFLSNVEVRILVANIWL
jgi:hypothetical protein